MKITNAKNIAVFAALLVALVAGYFLQNNPSSKSLDQTTSAIDESPQPEAKTSTTTASRSTEQQLLYLIEEEKMAHDLYKVMYQKYGVNVFGNILKSESDHQDRVLALLQSRGIADPRSAELGVFKNQELQAFYDKLVEQGNKNLAEAYMVGVAIEEKDIADITAELETTSDQEVITTLELLRSASENHLRAFNRQLI